MKMQKVCWVCLEMKENFKENYASLFKEKRNEKNKGCQNEHNLQLSEIAMDLKEI